jgi:hypothetical protein
MEFMNFRTQIPDLTGDSGADYTQPQQSKKALSAEFSMIFGDWRCRSAMRRHGRIPSFAGT